ncbi:DUF3149 domain-containing protein [Neisseria leonii]|uniref:DUF3149 domain-containing protein n=1 Tax=Neisseria leonii TaxID=2995413 RepID=A0A9X4ICV4_9NEIS|nr:MULTISPECIES: DUF3149 domain-containing protein [unclassified Neisseria]MDD9325389.1 DUF3149 domain-containing protein [Neisseria sp. 3986]MDD9327026.1 DUF3149 domain-containing protein [Neisseria sp. 51.81]
MGVFLELFKSPVGILSAFTISFVVVIAAYLFFWVRKQAGQSPKKP